MAEQPAAERFVRRGIGGERGARLAETGWPLTELARGLPKLDPLDVVRDVLDAVEANQVEVLAGERTRRVKSLLPDDHEKIYPAIQATWDASHHPRAT